MTEFDGVLDTIRQIVERYQSGEYLDEGTLKDLHRQLSANLYYLNEFRVDFKNQWDKEYMLCQEKTHAARERFADRQVPELYLCRKLCMAGQDVLISMSLNLKY